MITIEIIHEFIKEGNYISLDELLPSARGYGEHHLAIYGLIAGMDVMALSLLIFTL
jgi:ZIP family zinc transporter